MLTDNKLCYLIDLYTNGFSYLRRYPAYCLDHLSTLRTQISWLGNIWWLQVIGDKVKGILNQPCGP